MNEKVTVTDPGFVPGLEIFIVISLKFLVYVLCSLSFVFLLSPFPWQYFIKEACARFNRF